MDLAGAELPAGTDWAKVSDYFAVVCASDEVLEADRDWPSTILANWRETINDVVIVAPKHGETAPLDYDLIEKSSGQQKADLNSGALYANSLYLAIRRHAATPSSTYIAGIDVYFGSKEKPVLAPGWQLVTASVGGNSANLNKGGDECYLAIKRVAVDVIDGPPPLRSLAVVLKGDPVPRDHVLDWRKNLNKGKYGDEVHLAHQLGEATSVCALPYRSVIQERYPKEDSPACPFPQTQLPMFVYPDGTRLLYRAKKSAADVPKPCFFPLVFTDINGKHNYAGCLTFYEPVPEPTVRKLVKFVRKAIGLGERRKAELLAANRASRFPDSARQLLANMSGNNPSFSTDDGTDASDTDTANNDDDDGSDSDGDATADSASVSSSLGGSRRGAFPLGDNSSSSHHSRGGGGAAAATSGASLLLLDPEAAAEDAEVTAKLAAGTVYAPKTLCAISRAPIYGALRQFLAHLYRTAAVPAASTTAAAAAAVAGGGGGGGAAGAGTAAGGATTAGASMNGEGSSQQQQQLLQLLPSPLWQLSVSVRMFVSCLPMPLAGGRAFHVHLPGGGGAVGARNGSFSSAYSAAIAANAGAAAAAAAAGSGTASPAAAAASGSKPRRSLNAGTSLYGAELMQQQQLQQQNGSSSSSSSGVEGSEEPLCAGSVGSALVLSAPPAAWLPLMDIDYTAPFRCLSVANVAAVFGLILQEAKLVFLSTRLALLTQVMETFRSLLFPFDWQSLYVPILPAALTGCLEAPGGYMIGLAVTVADVEAGTVAIARNLHLEGVAHIVNLDLNELLLPSGRMHRDASAPSRPRVTGEGGTVGSLPTSPQTNQQSSSLLPAGVFSSSSSSNVGSSGAGPNSSSNGSSAANASSSSNSSSNGAANASGSSGSSSAVSSATAVLTAPFCPLNGAAVNHQIARKTVPGTGPPPGNSSSSGAGAGGDRGSFDNNNSSSGGSSSNMNSGSGSSANSPHGGSSSGSALIGDEEAQFLSLPAGVHSALVSRLVREVSDKGGVSPGASAALDSYSDPFAPFATAAAQYGVPVGGSSSSNSSSALVVAAGRRPPHSPGSGSGSGSSKSGGSSSPRRNAPSRTSSAFITLPNMPALPNMQSLTSMPGIPFFKNSSSSSAGGRAGGAGAAAGAGGGGAAAAAAAGFDADVIRDAFLCAMVDLLGDLGEHMLPQGKGFNGGGGFGWGDISTTPLNSLFDTGTFLEKADHVSRPFVNALSTTQMFWVLVQQWVETSENDDKLVFFEDCVKVWKQRKLKMAGAAAAAAAAAAREGEGGVAAASAAVAAAVTELDATSVSGQVRRQQLGYSASSSSSSAGAGGGSSQQSGAMVKRRLTLANAPGAVAAAMAAVTSAAAQLSPSRNASISSSAGLDSLHSEDEEDNDNDSVDGADDADTGTASHTEHNNSSSNEHDSTAAITSDNTAANAAAAAAAAAGGGAGSADTEDYELTEAGLAAKERRARWQRKRAATQVKRLVLELRLQQSDAPPLIIRAPPPGPLLPVAPPVPPKNPAAAATTATAAATAAAAAPTPAKVGSPLLNGSAAGGTQQQQWQKPALQRSDTGSAVLATDGSSSSGRLPACAWPQCLDWTVLSSPVEALPQLVQKLRTHALMVSASGEGGGGGRKYLLAQELQGRGGTEDGSAGDFVEEALRVYVSGFAVHLLCLPSAVAASGGSDRAVSGAMVGLGIVHHLQSLGLSTLIDEAMWRYLLVACGHIGGEFMKQIAAALFDAMRACAITPNSVTYGLYTKALAEENSRQVFHSIGQAYAFLEEMGLQWCEAAVGEGFDRSRLRRASMDLRKISLAAASDAMVHSSRKPSVKPIHEEPSSSSTAAANASTGAATATGSSGSTAATAGAAAAGSPGEKGSAAVCGASVSDDDRWVDSVTALGMWSHVKCSACGYGLMDEEVMARWKLLETEEFRVECARCAELLIPYLGYRIYKHPRDSAAAAAAGAAAAAVDAAVAAAAAAAAAAAGPAASTAGSPNAAAAATAAGSASAFPAEGRLHHGRSKSVTSESLGTPAVRGGSSGGIVLPVPLGGVHHCGRSSSRSSGGSGSYGGHHSSSGGGEGSVLSFVTAALDGMTGGSFSATAAATPASPRSPSASPPRSPSAVRRPPLVRGLSINDSSPVHSSAAAAATAAAAGSAFDSGSDGHDFASGTAATSSSSSSSTTGLSVLIEGDNSSGSGSSNGAAATGTTAAATAVGAGAGSSTAGRSFRRLHSVDEAGPVSPPTLSPAAPSAARRGPCGSVSGNLPPDTEGTVIYLSPVALRRQLERLQLTHGDECLTVEWVRKHRRHLYWNIVWFTTRLSLPMPLRQSDRSKHRKRHQLLQQQLLQQQQQQQQQRKASGTAGSGALGSPSSSARQQSHTAAASPPPLQQQQQPPQEWEELVVVGWQKAAVLGRCRDLVMWSQECVAARTRVPPCAPLLLVRTVLPPPALGTVFPGVTPRDADVAGTVLAMLQSRRAQGMPDALSRLQQLLAPRTVAAAASSSGSAAAALITAGPGGWPSADSRRESSSAADGSSSSSSSGPCSFTEGAYVTLLKLTAAAHIGGDLEPTALISQLRKRVEPPPFESAFVAATMALGDRDAAARRRNAAAAAAAAAAVPSYRRDSAMPPAAPAHPSPAQIRLLDEVPHDRALVYRSIWGFLGC